MSTLSPEVALEKGAKILAAKLCPLGFTFSIVEQTKGSGGRFAIGALKQGDRELRLWFRYELGGVSYRKADVERSHAEFMQFLGMEDKAAYPGFGGGDPLAGFHHLLQDLEYCTLFFDQYGEGFYSAMKNYVFRPKPTGLAALSKHGHH